MELFVGINTASLEIILISDKKERLEEKIRQDSAKHNPDNCKILSTSNVSFSTGFTADISYAYDLQCLEETILTRLSELGIEVDTPETKQLLDKLVTDAYHDIMHYDVSEDYAISEAFKLHKGELETLNQSTEEHIG